MSGAPFATTFEPYGKGLKAPVGALLDQDLLGRLRRYKRQVAKRYRVVEPDVVERLLPDETLFVSPKLDGELWFLVHAPPPAGAGVALVAYNGRVLTGVTTLAGVPERLASAPSLVIAGELYAPPATGERARNHHTGAALSEGRLESTLKFRAFDLVEENGEDALLRPYEQRLASLQRYLGDELVVPTERGNAALVAQRYREWAAPGSSQKHEGIVARSERGLTYKIKPTITVDLVVVAYGERITGEVRQVRELEVALVREDGSLQLVGSVGGGMSEDDRSRWHARLSTIEARSSFRLANREGTLCRFVRPEIVVEVRVSDFLSTDAWDAPIRRMALAYDAEQGYRPLSELRTAVLIHPVLLRERTDKKADGTDAGLSQITSYLEDAAPEARAIAPTRRASEVVRRGVYVKETKGQRAVRKYVVIRTNKEHEGAHPPFVVHFTDYSAGRKTPLETALRTAATVEGADRAVAAWIEENVKKGWVEVGASPAPAAAAPEAAEKPAEEPPAPKRSRAKKPKTEPG
ncbi:MAG: hypothetical protein U0234_04620 [Sandaracinus sp.]